MIERSKLQKEGLRVLSSKSQRDRVCLLQEDMVKRFRGFGPKSRQRAILSIRVKSIEYSLLYDEIDLDEIDDFSAACLYEWHPEIGVIWEFLEKLHVDLCMEEALSETE